MSQKIATGLLGQDDGEQVELFSLSELLPFHDHPFQVNQDQGLEELKESIALQGVATPILVREHPKQRGMYEIVAGHRRVEASRLLNLETIPGFIRDLDDDEAVLFMVDTNIQREQLRFSEKAFAYRMKLEALKRKAGRPAQNGGQVGHHLKGRDILAEGTGDSARNIQRYIRLTYLEKALLDLVDAKSLPFLVGVELSYLKPSEQICLHQKMKDEGCKPSLAQATALKEASQGGGVTQEFLRTLFQEEKPKKKKLSLRSDVREYFPENTSSDEMEEVILDLLRRWKEEQSF